MFDVLVGKGRQTDTRFADLSSGTSESLIQFSLYFLSSAASHDQRDPVTGFILNYNSPI